MEQENKTDASAFILECFKQVMDNLDETEKSYVGINQNMFIQLFNRIVLTTLELKDTSTIFQKNT